MSARNEAITHKELNFHSLKRANRNVINHNQINWEVPIDELDPPTWKRLCCKIIARGRSQVQKYRPSTAPQAPIRFHIIKRQQRFPSFTSMNNRRGIYFWDARQAIFPLTQNFSSLLDLENTPQNKIPLTQAILNSDIINRAYQLYGQPECFGNPNPDREFLGVAASRVTLLLWSNDRKDCRIWLN